MRVICINDTWGCGQTVPKNGFPIYGEYYNVIGERDYPDEKYYILAEYGILFDWKVSHFAPLSEIDETEMIREYNKELL